MKRLLPLWLSVIHLILLNSSIVGVENVLRSDVFMKNLEEVVSDKVVLDQDIKTVLTHAFFSRYRAELAARASFQRRRDIITAPLSNINREDFKQFSGGVEPLLSELINKCQKHHATVHVMGIPFMCKNLEEFLGMIERNPRVLEISDWWSFFFGGYSKKVQLSSQAIEKLSRL